VTRRHSDEAQSGQVVHQPIESKRWSEREPARQDCEDGIKRCTVASMGVRPRPHSGTQASYPPRRVERNPPSKPNADGHESAARVRSAPVLTRRELCRCKAETKSAGDGQNNGRRDGRDNRSFNKKRKTRGD